MILNSPHRHHQVDLGHEMITIPEPPRRLRDPSSSMMPARSEDTSFSDVSGGERMTDRLPHKGQRQSMLLLPGWLSTR